MIIQQAKEEIEAYKSLVPNGSEIIATLMFELDIKNERGFSKKSIKYRKLHIFDYWKRTSLQLSQKMMLKELEMMVKLPLFIFYIFLYQKTKRIN